MVDILSWWLWPFGVAFFGIWIVVALAFLVFWIWMLVDIIKRQFRNRTEKIIWIVLMIFGGWIISLVYLLVIRQNNKKGIMKK